MHVRGYDVNLNVIKALINEQETEEEYSLT